MVVAASRVHVPAAQVQDRRQRRPARSRRHPGARHRPAGRAQRGGRTRLHRLCRRRARPHAVDRQESARVPAGARFARLLRGDFARLQSRRPARQQIQGAHQDPAAREGAGGLREAVEDEFAALDQDRLRLPARTRSRASAPISRRPICSIAPAESARVKRRRAKDARFDAFFALQRRRRTRSPAMRSSRCR